MITVKTAITACVVKLVRCATPVQTQKNYLAAAYVYFALSAKLALIAVSAKTALIATSATTHRTKLTKPMYSVMYNCHKVNILT